MLEKINQNFSVLRREKAKDFKFFRRFYLEHYHTHKDAPFHGEVVEILSLMTKKRGKKLALAAPRDSAKSSIISLAYVLYCICYKTEAFIVLISNTADQAIGLLNSVKYELESNERLRQDFPEVCETGRKPMPPRWCRGEIITRNGINVLALSSGQQIRGRRNREARPSLIILDDVETSANSTPESSDKLQDWVTKSVFKAGTSTTNIIFTGTIHHYGSLLSQYVDSKAHAGWIKQIYRSIIRWSDHPELWEKWAQIYNFRESFEGEEGPQAAKAFFETNKEVMLQGVEVLWPAGKTYYELMVMREDEGPYSFDSEMQNEPIDPRDCCFRMEELHFYDEKESAEDALAPVKDNLINFGACDPSLGKHIKRGDFSAILSAGLDTKTKIIYIRDADIERRQPDKTIDTIIGFQKVRNYRKFAFETNQFQEFVASELTKRAQASGAPVNLKEIKHSTDKIARIQSLQPMVKSGMIRFSRRHTTLLEQMKYFPKGKYDDGLDALEMVVKLCLDQINGGGCYIGTVEHDTSPD